MLSTHPNPALFLSGRVSSAARRLLAGCCYCLPLLLGTACSDDNATDTATVPVDKETLRQNATSFYQALYSPAQTNLDSYVTTDYVEHQLNTGFTLAGLKTYAQNRTQARGAARLIIHRTLVQGDLVALHVEEQVAADSSVAHMALFRFDANGKITAHWEAVQGQPRRRANPNTMFDGAAVNYQSTIGIRSREAIVAAEQRAFNSYDTLLVRQTHTPEYIQHNPLAPNGVGGLIGLLTFLKSQGITTTLTTYQQLAEGDFVLALNNYQTKPGVPGFTDPIGFDLIRVDETGKAAEHWDVLEELNGADKSKVF
ncbi:nuclear transport factor 2 family protein [Hymenobacter terrenus]|uniref:nuclear transport factor 2 family protein n=1 Tax=Hymenobacter terrenus TaxID=1629124 RepID=UPI000A911AA9|nr:hypothetical protein [Hymenobacter terrenus]